MFLPASAQEAAYNAEGGSLSQALSHMKLVAMLLALVFVGRPTMTRLIIPI